MVNISKCLKQAFRCIKPKKINVEKAHKALKEVDHIFSHDLKIEYWLQDGTLLGFVREGGVLKHDKDLDVGVKIENYNDKLILAFLDYGWILRTKFGKRECGLILNFFKKNISLDIFFYYFDKDYMWHSAYKYIDTGWLMAKYKYKPFGVTRKRYNNYEFLVPEDQEYFLRTKYGDEWLEVKKKWDYFLDPKNVEVTDIIFKNPRGGWHKG